MSDSVKPVFHKNEHVGEFSFEDAYDLHVRHLPNVIDFHEILHDLQEGLQGVWEYSYPSGTCYALASPVFNRHGDLIVQLRTQDPHAKPLPPPQAPALGGIICALPPRSPILLTPAVSFADKPVPFEAKPKVAPPPLVQPKINVTKPKVVPVPEKPKIQKKESSELHPCPMGTRVGWLLTRLPQSSDILGTSPATFVMAATMRRRKARTRPLRGLTVRRWRRPRSRTPPRRPRTSRWHPS